jgi:sugar lactone lactonase YvrE
VRCHRPRFVFLPLALLLADPASVFGQTYTIATIAGTGAQGCGQNCPAILAAVNHPYGVAVDSTGKIYIADTFSNRVLKLSDGIVTTLAGTGTPGFSGDGGPATSAALNDPSAVAVDAAGNVYIADTDNSRVRVVSNGIITSIAGGFGAGTPVAGIQLGAPRGLAVDLAGNLYIADYGGSRVLKLSNGVATTIAGNGTFGFSGDNGPAVSAALAEPYGLAADSAGNLYISDPGNSRVRKV